MAPRFADLESRVTGAVFARLANAVATFDGGSEVAGIFDQPYAQSDIGSMGFESTRPTFKLPSNGIPSDVVGRSVTVRGASYQVVSHEPDGTGMSTLVLEQVTS